MKHILHVCFFLFSIVADFAGAGPLESELIFQNHKYSIKSPNLTIASLIAIHEIYGGQQFESISSLMAIMCTIDAYNSESGGIVKVPGNFNSLAFDTRPTQDFRLHTEVNGIIGQNLVYSQNGTSFSAIPETPIGAIIGIGTDSNFLGEGLVTTGFPIPFIFSESRYSIAAPPIVSVPKMEATAYSVSVMSSSSSVDLVYAINEILSAFNWTLVGVLFSSDSAGVSGFESTEALAQEFSQNVTYPCFSTISIPAETSAYESEITAFSSCVSSVKDLRVIILWMNSKDAVVTSKNITDITGLDNQLVFIIPAASTQILSTVGFLDMSIFVYPSSQADQSLTQTCNPEIMETLSNYTSEFKLTSVSVGPGYCYGSNLEQISCNSGLSFSDSCNCTDSYMYSFAADSVNVLMMAIYYMQNNCSFLKECAQSQYRFYQDFCSITEFDLHDLSIAIKCVNFTGLSGRISFFNFSVYRQSVPLKVMQIQKHHNIVQIGSITGFNAQINTDLAYFYNNQTIISEIVVDDPDVTNSAVVAVFFALDIILMIITVAFALFIFICRKNRVIRKASPLFCLLILLGLLLGELSLFFISLRTSDFICRISDWTLLIGISLVIGGLLAKNYRIYRIFGNRSALALEISDLDLIYFTGAVLLVTCILFILYQTVDGPLQLIVEQSPDISYYYFAICLVGNSGVQTGFTIAFYVYFVLLFIAAAVLAFLNRKVDDAYNESGDLAFIACSWIALAIIYAPIFYLQSVGTNSNSTRYAIRYMAIEIAIALALAVLFVPKILAAIRYERKRRV